MIFYLQIAKESKSQAGINKGTPELILKKIKNEVKEDSSSSTVKAPGLKGDASTKVKQEVGSVKSIKKEEGVLSSEKKVKKDSDVIKTVKKTITTVDGRVINAVVKVFRNGKKVMYVNGKEKVLNPGKSKDELAGPSKTVQKDDLEKKSGDSSKAVKKEVGSSKSKISEHPPIKSEKTKQLIETKPKTSQNVDDLLKRGIKKKSHLPFGNKNTFSKHHKGPNDGKGEGSEKSLTVGDKKETPLKLVDKKERKKSEEFDKKKGASGEKKRRSSSETNKPHVNSDRRLSVESSHKGDKRKSTDKKTSIEHQKPEESKEDLPALVPISQMTKPVKHKHAKVEHEVPLDMTMNDLFKPDGMIILDSTKKEENAVATVSIEESKKISTASFHDPESPIKPQNLPHVLIEHDYSKPSSPVHAKTQDDLSLGLRQQDIDSVSHHVSGVAVDANLPDQFMEEPVNRELEEPSVCEGEESGHLQQEQGVDKGRISIFQSLDKEIQEGGSELLIAGQTEVGRMSEKTTKEESILSNSKSVSSKEAKTNGKKSTSEAKAKSGEHSKSHKSRKDSTGMYDLCSTVEKSMSTIPDSFRFLVPPS